MATRKICSLNPTETSAIATPTKSPKALSSASAANNLRSLPDHLQTPSPCRELKRRARGRYWDYRKPADANQTNPCLLPPAGSHKSWVATEWCGHFPASATHNPEPPHCGSRNPCKSIYPHQTSGTQRWSRRFHRCLRLQVSTSNTYHSHHKVIPIRPLTCPQALWFSRKVRSWHLP